MSAAQSQQTQQGWTVSSTEVIALLAMLYSAPLVFAPIRMFSVAADSAWLAGFVSGIFGALIVAIWVTISTAFPGMSLPEIVVALLGPWLGWTTNLIFSVLFILETAVATRMIGEVMRRLLPDTPMPAIIVLALVVGLVIARLGPEVMGRLASIHLFVVIVTVIFSAAALAGKSDLGRFLPVMADGIGPVLNASLTPTALLGHVVLLALLLPHMRKTNDPKQPARARFREGMRVGLIGMGLTWMVFHVLLLLEQAVFGAQEAARLAIPALSLVRMIQLGVFFERVEASMVAVWLPAAFLKLTAFLYAAAVMVKHVSGSKEFRWYVLPLVVLIAPIALTLADSTTKLIVLINGTWAVVQIIVKVGIPIVLLVLVPPHMRLRHGK